MVSSTIKAALYTHISYKSEIIAQEFYRAPTLWLNDE